MQVNFWGLSTFCRRDSGVCLRYAGEFFLVRLRCAGQFLGSVYAVQANLGSVYAMYVNFCVCLRSAVEIFLGSVHAMQVKFDAVYAMQVNFLGSSALCRSNVAVRLRCTGEIFRAVYVMQVKFRGLSSLFRSIFGSVYARQVKPGVCLRYAGLFLHPSAPCR